MAMAAKFARALELLRYGPTRLDEALVRVGAAEAQAAIVGSRLAELGSRLAALESQLTNGMTVLQHAIGVASADSSASRAIANEAQLQLGWIRDQIGGLAAALDRVQAPSAPATTSLSTGAAEEGFYPALEREFRGSEQDVRARLTRYRDWVTELPEGSVADIGCGRGEWLVLLGEWGRAAEGVDLNALNVAELRKQGLNVQCADALQWLAEQGDGNFAALTAFHVIEHLPFGVLLRLVQEARRVLRPGGRLILETPNPENLDVATRTFWLDPTHLRPLPPALIELVLRNAGLELEATLRLNAPEGDGGHITDATLRGLLMQGRDYAVIARKPKIAAA